MDQLAEDHTVPEEEDEVPGPGPGAQGGVAGGDDPPLVQPAQALPPHRLHHRQKLLFEDHRVECHNITYEHSGHH